MNITPILATVCWPIWRALGKFFTKFELLIRPAVFYKKYARISLSKVIRITLFTQGQ